MEELTNGHHNTVLNGAISYTNPQNDEENVEIMVIEYVDDSENIQTIISESVENGGDDVQYNQEYVAGDFIQNSCDENQYENEGEHKNVEEITHIEDIPESSLVCEEEECQYLEEEYLTEEIPCADTQEGHNEVNLECEVMKMHKCKECGLQLVSETLLKYHRYKNKHDLPFTCRQCKKQFTELRDIITHEEEHSLIRPYQCLDCSQDFTLAVDLLSHRKIHLNSKTDKPKEGSPKRYQCSKCSLISPNMRYHRKHLSTHRKVSMVSCHICKDQFTSASDLRQHVKQHYDFQFQCMDCCKVFKEAEDLKSHRIIHSSNAYIPILPKPDRRTDLKIVWKS